MFLLRKKILCLLLPEQQFQYLHKWQVAWSVAIEERETYKIRYNPWKFTWQKEFFSPGLFFLYNGNTLNICSQYFLGSYCSVLLPFFTIMNRNSPTIQGIFSKIVHLKWLCKSTALNVCRDGAAQNFRACFQLPSRARKKRENISVCKVLKIRFFWQKNIVHESSLFHLNENLSWKLVFWVVSGFWEWRISIEIIISCQVI